MTQANASGKVRRGAGLLALICFLVLAGLGIRHVVHQPYFDIHHIEVTGDTSFTNVGALEKTLWEKLNGNYFFSIRCGRRLKRCRGWRPQRLSGSGLIRSGLKSKSAAPLRSGAERV